MPEKDLGVQAGKLDYLSLLWGRVGGDQSRGRSVQEGGWWEKGEPRRAVHAGERSRASPPLGQVGRAGERCAQKLVHSLIQVWHKENKHHK